MISVRGSFIVLQKCVRWKIQINFLFINDLEVIKDLVNPKRVKPLVNPKRVVTIVIIDTKRKCKILNSSNSKQKLHRKRGVTPHTSQIKLNS